MCLKTGTILIKTHLSSVSTFHNDMPIIYNGNLSTNVSIKYCQVGLLGPLADFER